jgi:hypothetical protein
MHARNMLQALGSPWSSSCSTSYTPAAQLCLQARLQQLALASSTLRGQCCHAKAYKRPWQAVAAAPQHSWHSSTDDMCFQKRRRITTACAQAAADCAEQQQDLHQAAKQRRMPVTVISGFLGTFNDADAPHYSLQAEGRAATLAGASSCAALASAHLWLVAAGHVVHSDLHSASTMRVLPLQVQARPPCSTTSCQTRQGSA